MEQKIQMLIPIVLRTVGPILLRSGLGGLGGGGTNSSPSLDDDDDDDEDDEKESKDDNTISGANGRKVSISLPTFPPDDDEDDDDEDKDNEKQSENKNDQGTSSTRNIPRIVSASTPEPLNPNIDLSVFDPEPASSSSTTTTETPSSLNDDESNDESAVILDKIDLRQNDSSYLASAPYVYELPPHKPNCENESKNDEFNSIR